MANPGANWEGPTFRRFYVKGPTFAEARVKVLELIAVLDARNNEQVLEYFAGLSPDHLALLHMCVRKTQEELGSLREIVGLAAVSCGLFHTNGEPL